MTKPNAIVTIARYGPRTRNAGSASRAPAAAAITAPTKAASINGMPAFAERIEAVYAPIAKNPAWPKEICPARPNSTLRPVATMVLIAIDPMISRW